MRADQNIKMMGYVYCGIIAAVVILAIIGGIIIAF